MVRLTIALLGPPRIEHDGQPLQVDTRKAIALLAYLAASGQAQRRDSLAALLWPEYDQESARSSLRRTLSALKKGLGGEWLESDREQIDLRSSSEVWVDVDAFSARLTETSTHGHASTDVCGACVAPLAAAAELHRGDFMEGFTLRESAAFDEWQVIETEAFRRGFAGVLERLTRALSRQHAFDDAIAYARRLLSLDPLDEAAHRQLMLLHAWRGERAAAIRQYRECVRILDAELGVPPLQETTDLVEAIKEGRTPGPPDPVRGPSREASGLVASAAVQVPPVDVEPRLHALVGRVAELRILADAYARVSTDGRLAVVEGEAGIGKTRLADELLRQVRSRGAAVVVGNCHAGEQRLAYAPFVDALRDAIARTDAKTLGRTLAAVPDHWLAEAAQLLPDLAVLRPVLAPPPTLDAPGAQSRFFEGLVQVLQALLNGEAPGVLFLDDLQWSDLASLELVQYLVRRLVGRRILVLLAWRSEEVARDHPLRHLVAGAHRAGMGTVVALARLVQAEVGEFLRASALTLPDGRSGMEEWLYQETEGLPFFLVEYVAAMQSGAAEGCPLPSGVRELLRMRLSGASETGRQLLATAAAVGRSFDFATLREVSGRGEQETIVALEDLMARGLIREIRTEPLAGPGINEAVAVFDFSHERLRELIYDETSLVRRRLLHRRIFNTLRLRARERDSGALAATLAHHASAAGDQAAAAEQFRLAGEHARAVYANADALAHFSSALALGHPDVAGLHESIADLQTLAGLYEQARTGYEVAAAQAPLADLPRLEHKLAQVHSRRGEWDLAYSHLEAAQAAVNEKADPGMRARLLADLSLVAYRRGESVRANQLAEGALRLAEAAGDQRALAQTHHMLGILATSRGEAESARQHLEKSLAFAQALSDPTLKVAALNSLALACGANGDLDHAIGLAEEALVLCMTYGDRHHQAALHSNLADLLYQAGRPEDALVHQKRAAPLFAEIGTRDGILQPEIWRLTEW